MKRHIILVCVVFLAGNVGAVADNGVEEGLRTRWLAAYNSGDAEALSEMYAADARLQQGYCPTVVGRDAIEQFWRDDIGDGTAKTHLEIEDTLSHDGMMYLRGSYAVETLGGPTERRIGGTYTQIWRLESAGWTIHRETWTNLACAEVRVEPPPADDTVSGTKTAI